MLKNFVEHVVKQLVDEKDAVVVTQRQEESKHIIAIRVATIDLGKVIGKEGTTIRALRAIVGIVGEQQGYDVVVEVAQ